MQAQEARPPYVTFELRAVEDRAETIAKGHPVYRDVAFAYITPQGSKDRIEQVVTEWFVKLERQVQDGRFQRSWLTHYQNAFKAWQDGQEIPESGTPVKNWPSATPAQIKVLLELRVRTVEDLAQANEETISRLGMGGRALKQRAVDWLTQAANTGTSVAAMEALRTANEALEQRNKTLEEEFRSLKARVAEMAKGAPVIIDAPRKL